MADKNSSNSNYRSYGRSYRGEKGGEDTIDLLALALALLKKWYFLLAGLLVGAIIAAIITLGFIKPQYTASMTLFVLTKTTSITSLSDIQLGSALTSDFAIVATSKPVIDTAIETLKEDTGVTYTRKQISDALTVTNVDDTRMLTVTVVYTDPQAAADIANAIGEATAEQIAAVMNSDPPRTVESAEAPTKKSSPSLSKNVVIGALIGFVLVAAVFVVIEILDDTIKNEDDIEQYIGVPVLAVIPLSKHKAKEAAAEDSAERKSARAKK